MMEADRLCMGQGGEMDQPRRRMLIRRKTCLMVPARAIGGFSRETRQPGSSTPKSRRKVRVPIPTNRAPMQQE